MYKEMPDGAFIGRATVTGYGEALVQAALKVDAGEIETVAHHRGARHFMPNVNFILDIGGQDMKCLQIKDGVINNIMLNEACSSGCGSFIQSLSQSLGTELDEFISQALFSQHPVDLGTRCTVFMNSKIKQVQKDGADLGGIAAGLAYSVVKNALYKVIRLSRASEIGENVVVQGGTFYNDAVLRSLEKIADKEVVRPDIAGIMGAFGCALLSKDAYLENEQSTILDEQNLDDFSYTSTTDHCKMCHNHCLLTIASFSDGRTCITGNRCEKGAGVQQTQNEMPDLIDYKYKRLFGYTPLTKEQAVRGEMGIPRALNMYEQYPFWFTFFTRLGFRVVLSARSSKKVFTLGMETIPSESLCYPAKLANGHVMELIHRGINNIFYPCVPKEHKEKEDAQNNYNCPVVSSYPEAIKANIDEIHDNNINYMCPFLPLESPKHTKKRLFEELSAFNISQKEINEAADAAYAELENFKNDMRREGEKTIKWMEDNGKKGIVLSGRPYHVDPEINHGIAQMINGLGLAVLTEDSVYHLAPQDYPLYVVNQWVYHARLYAAAAFVGTRDDLELVQLNSFGCGLDAVTTDQVEKILEDNNKTFTLVKIDEINNLGAVRIRIRSLLAAMGERDKKGIRPHTHYKPIERIPFTKEMRETYTVLCPQMAPIHFSLMEDLLRLEGYNVEVLKDETPEIIEEGLLHVHNDACYPSILTIGQMMSALKSGKYDLNRTALVMTQTGGCCRASNYTPFIRKALRESGMEQVPVVSANTMGWEKNPGFKVTYSMIKKAAMVFVYGDLLMKLTYATRPYEINKGQTDAALQEFVTRFKDLSPMINKNNFEQLVGQTVEYFEAIPAEFIPKPKVGVVGEILIKYHDFGNNYIVDTIEREGGEAVVPSIAEFFMAFICSNEYKEKKLGGSKVSVIAARVVEKWAYSYLNISRRALEKSSRYKPSPTIREIAHLAEEILELGHQIGEGWLLTGEMAELLNDGVDNICCLQPFACLPNHIVGKGMFRELKRHYPGANIVALDYDPGSSKVNQDNRIKLMMSMAHKSLQDKLKISKTVEQ